MSKYRWIMYMGQDRSAGVSFDLSRHSSLEAVRQAFRDYCKAVYTDDCHASLHSYSDERWVEAKEMEDIGSPFDYPSKVMYRGINGGVLIENA